MDPLKDKVALVAGGAGGVGREIADAFLRAGAEVVLVDTDRRELETARDAIAESGRELLTRGAKEWGEEAVGELFAWIMERWGRIDILVNSLGPALIGRFRETSHSGFLAHLEARMSPVFLTCREAGRAMAAGRIRGRIVNLIGVLERPGIPCTAVHAAGEAAVAGFSRELARELAPHSVTVNCISVGALDEKDYLENAVGAWARMDGVSRAQERKLVLGNVPGGRLVLPREIADAVLFLCREPAAGVTAQVLGLGRGSFRSVL